MPDHNDLPRNLMSADEARSANTAFWSGPQRAHIDHLFQGGAPSMIMPTPQTLIETIMYAVRKRGLAALSEVATIERLSRCDEEALAETNSRIFRLIKRGQIAAEIDAPAPSTETINV